MSQDYKLKFDQMHDSHPGRDEAKGNDNYYGNEGYSRNVAFVLPNGDIESFNYGHLVSPKYRIAESAIYLIFSSETVMLKGYGLEQLFFELFDQRNRIIRCTDPRYAVLEKQGAVVTDIVITKNP